MCGAARVRNLRPVLLALLLACVACGALRPTASPIPATSTPVPPTATPPPTPTAEASVHFDGIVVTFDGSGCTVEGLKELPTGDHSFLLIDDSGKYVTLWVSRIAGEGKTYQDLVDAQTEPGAWWPEPSWVAYDTEVETDYLDAGMAWTYRLDVAGEHFISVGSTSPPTLWLCAPLTVVEEPSG